MKKRIVCLLALMMVFVAAFSLTERSGLAEGAAGAGEYNGELLFQGLEWGMDGVSATQRLQEAGFIDEEIDVVNVNNTNMIHWPDEDLLFVTRQSVQLPEVFETHEHNGLVLFWTKARNPIGGGMPHKIILHCLSSIGKDGKVIRANEKENRLVGVELEFWKSENNQSVEVFNNLLNEIESQYQTKFTMYIPRGLSRNNNKTAKDIYNSIKKRAKDAIEYKSSDLKGEKRTSMNVVLCILHGANNTGIVLGFDGAEKVTLFYGKTDVMKDIMELAAALEKE